MGGRLSVWKDALLVWHGKVVELGEHDGIFLMRWMGMNSGRPISDCWEMLEWNLDGRCRSCFGWIFLDGFQVGNMDGGMVGKFWLDPGWGIRQEFWLGIVKRRPARTIRRSFGGEMGRWGYRWSRWRGSGWKCEMGMRWDQEMTACLEVPKPRLCAHADRDPRAKRGDLLLNIYHES